jgi:hypothetical protein
MGESKRKVIEHVPADVALSAGQREQMAALISNLNTARIVAEQFIGYFAKEQGVNLQLYQFDSNRLVFVPAYAPPMPPAQELEPELEPETMNGVAHAINNP